MRALISYFNSRTILFSPENIWIKCYFRNLYFAHKTIGNLILHVFLEKLIVTQMGKITSVIKLKGSLCLQNSTIRCYPEAYTVAVSNPTLLSLISAYGFLRLSFHSVYATKAIKLSP
jgi:hypothetical protein